MAAVPIQIDGVLWDQAQKKGAKVTLIGHASILGLTIGGGPIFPPDTSPPEPGPPGHPEHPIWGPPGSNFPGGPGSGYPPVAGHPLPPMPPDPPSNPSEPKPPPPDGGWGWHPDYGWGYFPMQGGKPQPIPTPPEVQPV